MEALFGSGNGVYLVRCYEKHASPIEVIFPPPIVQGAVHIVFEGNGIKVLNDMLGFVFR